ncbi:MAG TPA: hypothetical protein VJ456_03495 [Acidimicrobiia bacterium]|nr:hypothetical protein [Acidimicrobiia bacterium]
MKRRLGGFTSLPGRTLGGFTSLPRRTLGGFTSLPRRTLLVAAGLALSVLAVLPPAGAEDAGGFFGFQRLATTAQGQVATGYFFAIGDEVNRIVGARTEIDGPPLNSRVVAAFIQRGIGATYVYGVAGGPGGGSGALPDPPPGEAPAYYPTDPHETTVTGPVTAVADGGSARTFDGRFHAKADDGAVGRAEAAVTRLEVPGYFTVAQAAITSRGGPTADGVDGEAVSILRGVTVGPLHIDSLSSRAYGFVSSLPGDPKGEASTVVEGATVGKVPVMITDHGVVVNDKTDPSAEQQVRAALAQAGLSDVRLLQSLARPSDNREEVTAQAGGLAVVHNDPKFGAQNPQGFRGGGFALGGAEVNVSAQRCDPACTSPSGAGEAPGLSFAPPGAAPSSSPSPSPSPSPASASAGSSQAAPAATASEVLSPVPSDRATFTQALTPVPGATPSSAPPERHLLPVPTAPRARPALRAALAAAGATAGGEAGDLARIFVALGATLMVVVTARGALGRLRPNPFSQEDTP